MCYDELRVKTGRLTGSVINRADNNKN